MNVAAILKVKGRSVTTASPTTSLLDIAAKLASKKIGAIVIVEKDDHVAGIISERDLVMAIAEQGESVLRQPVSSLMTTDVTTCEETRELEDLMGLMTKGRFRHVPVVQKGALVGIISIGDVVKHHIAEVEMEISAMRGYLATG